MTLTDEQLDEIEAWAKAATPGPWEVPPFGVNGGEPWRIINGPKSNIIGNYDTGGIGSTKADSDFIAHARADVPALIAALRASRARERRLEGLLKEAFPHIGSEYERSWPDDEGFDDMIRRIRAELGWSEPSAALGEEAPHA